MERKIIWIGADRGSWRGPGMTRFRHPDAVALRPMALHQVWHSLTRAPSEELMLLHYLMRITGMSCGSERRGVVAALFGTEEDRIGELRRRGWLMYEMPWRMLLESLATDELRMLLRRHSLPVTGLKADLIERVRRVLTTEEAAELRRTHSVWVPTAMGYEMLYSYYVDWEEAQKRVIGAIFDADVERVIEEEKWLMRLYPVTDGMCIDVTQIEILLGDFRDREPEEDEQRELFYKICGFDPLFWFRTEGCWPHPDREVIL